ncbi:uncharacterized protein METZ01_LOCUS407419 [marine metagenome]|uniref:Uncharacterized protein n=1 Tax=marine metagenome TaxID=408172 RepID=A0A382W8A5_9ZZZZ
MSIKLYAGIAFVIAAIGWIVYTTTGIPMLAFP